MSKTLQDARLPSLRDKINNITPEDTAEAVVKKIKKEDIKKRSALGVKKDKTK